MISDIWRNISKRIGFYTKETQSSIPDLSGIYAWFVPLWIVDDDIETFISLISNYYLYDPIVEGIAQKTLCADFNWESYQVQLKKGVSKSVFPSKEIVLQWKDMMKDEKKKEAFSNALMEASIFMPPLYVGKADNLRDRYNQHVSGKTISEKNTFYKRFSSFKEKNNLRFRVNDLIFACILTDTKTSETFREANLNWLLEQVVMRLCRPTFSIK
jgi:hypothetical protein